MLFSPQILSIVVRQLTKFAVNFEATLWILSFIKWDLRMFFLCAGKSESKSN